MILSESNLIKKEYQHLGTSYFNSAYFGPSPYRAKQKIANATFKELDPSFYFYNTWMGIPDRIRSLISKLLGVKEGNICLQTSVSDINSLIATGIHLDPDDLVCSHTGEYPSNVLPWMLGEKRGRFQFQLIKQSPLEPKKFIEALPKNCKVVSLSHVQFDTGERRDLLELGKLLKEKNIIFIVDSTQSLGGIHISKEEIKNIDILSCAGYKWILGPYGQAFAYFSSDIIKKIDCMNASWTKSPNSKKVHSLLDYTIDTLPGARKFDRGQPSNMLTNSALEASLEFLLEVGLKKIEEHNSGIRDYFLEHYPKSKYQIITPKDHYSNIISLKANGIESHVLETELRHRNFDVSVREGKLRLSFHLFNNQSQVEHLVQAIDL